MNFNNLHMKSRIYLFFLAISWLPLAACGLLPVKYSADPINARVVDAETGTPLEGVIITANWQLEEGTVGGNVPAGQLKVMETMTDAEGRFHFPGFAPTRVEKGFLVNRDPQLLLYKRDYEYQRLLNEYSSDQELRARKARRSDWNGATIKLQRFKGTLKQYAEHLFYLDDELSFAYWGNSCEWRQIPRMLVALQKEEWRLKNSGVTNSLRTIDSVAYPEKCGNPRELFKEYLK